MSKGKSSMSSWEAYLNENQKRFIDELKAFLWFPSISSLPQHAGDVKQAADWVADWAEVPAFACLFERSDERAKKFMATTRTGTLNSGNTF